MISLQSHFEAVENFLSNTATFQEVVAKILLQYEKRQMSASDMPPVLQIGVPTCYHCNKKGHVRRKCRVKRAEIERMTKIRPLILTDPFTWEVWPNKLSINLPTDSCPAVGIHANSNVVNSETEPNTTVNTSKNDKLENRLVFSSCKTSLS